MDLKAVREAAIEATTRAFWDRNGFVPDEDSEEWEEEYRRQFEEAKRRAVSGRAEVKPNVPVAVIPPEENGWTELTGAPTQIRWAAALRAERLKEIKDPAIRDWLTTTWNKGKSWIDTGDLPTQIFLQRIAPHYAEYRKVADQRARVLAAKRQATEVAAEAVRREIEAAGITVAGLIELIDIAERLPALPVKAKLAELDESGRNLRVFETADPSVLVVLEKAEGARSEYGVERDDGLVADLQLFARAAGLS
jgi:hypothetical protein